MKKGLIGLLVLALAMTFGLGAMAETTSDETVDCYACLLYTSRVHRRDRAGKRPLRSVRRDADLRPVSLR